jgi:hypothetical protein
MAEKIKETGEKTAEKTETTHAIVNSRNTALERSVEDWRDKTIALEKRIEEMSKALDSERSRKSEA